MGAVLQLETRPANSEIICELKQLHLAREALVRDRTAARNRAKSLSIALLKRHNTERMKQIERQIDAIETEIEARLRGEPELARRFDILLSIPGIARLTAFALLIHMPELGCQEPGQAASLSGLAPVARQSRKWTGNSSSEGGQFSVEINTERMSRWRRHSVHACQANPIPEYPGQGLNTAEPRSTGKQSLQAETLSGCPCPLSPDTPQDFVPFGRMPRRPPAHMVRGEFTDLRTGAAEIKIHSQMAEATPDFLRHREDVAQDIRSHHVVSGRSLLWRSLVTNGKPFAGWVKPIVAPLGRTFLTGQHSNNRCLPREREDLHFRWSLVSGVTQQQLRHQTAGNVTIAPFQGTIEIIATQSRPSLCRQCRWIPVFRRPNQRHCAG